MELNHHSNRRNSSAIEEVATNGPFVSSSVACPSTGMQNSMQSANFLMGAVYSFKNSISTRRT